MTVDADEVADRLSQLRDLIEDRATRPVRIVAVTKQFGPDAVLAALAAGVADIGENYAQELVQKATDLEAADAAAVRWHFIGHLQRNKVRMLAPLVDLWQTIDTVRLGSEVARHAPGAGVLVQVNFSGAPTQAGVDPDDVGELVDQLRDLGLDVCGLMQIGAVGDLDRTRVDFERMRAMADDLELPECSMGMSADLEVALAAGTTIVRLGTALFGPRGQRAIR